MLTTNLSNRDFIRLVDSMIKPYAPTTPTETLLSLPIDVFESNDVLTVRASLPGVAPEDAEITFEGNTLTIQGQTHNSLSTTQEGDVKVFRQENAFGKFRRSIRLSHEFDGAAAHAQFQHGIVTVSIPRKETAKPKVVRIPVTNVVEPIIQATVVNNEQEAGQ